MKSLITFFFITADHSGDHCLKQSQTSHSLTTMTTPRSKSPRLGNQNKNDKEESFWDKIGTLGRKKRIKEGKV